MPAAFDRVGHDRATATGASDLTAVQSRPERIRWRGCEESSESVYQAPPHFRTMDASRFLVAGGLALWLGGLVAAAAYISRRMRFPKSMYARDAGGAPGWLGAIAGLILYAVTAFALPTVG